MNSADIGLKSALLSQPLAYFPVHAGPFEFRTGLRRLEPDLAMPDTRQQVFQFDCQWPEYRRTKLQSRREQFDKYVCRQELAPGHASNATAWLIKKLVSEHPRLFSLQVSRHHQSLQCVLTNETLVFDERMELTDAISGGSIHEYRDALDALCCQFQEDLAITLAGNGDDRIAYLHLCLPNYWAPQDKIGQNFIGAHRPVPGMQKITTRAVPLVDMLAQDGPFERFAWGLTTDTRLNHHPDAPPAMDPVQWQGRKFDPVHPELYLRIERQVTAAIPDSKAFLFTIRTYLRDIRSLDRNECRRLLQALTTMPEDVLTYKGLYNSYEMIISWLDKVLNTLTGHHG